MKKLLPCLFLVSFLLLSCQRKKNTPENNHFPERASDIPLPEEKQRYVTVNIAASLLRAIDLAAATAVISPAAGGRYMTGKETK